MQTSNMTIFAVSLAKDWSTRDSIFAGKAGVKGVLIFLSFSMFVLFVCCGVSLIFHFSHSKKTFNIAKISVVFLLFYCGLRAVYFLLFALEKLDSVQNSNPAGFFFFFCIYFYLFIFIFICFLLFLFILFFGYLFLFILLFFNYI